MPLRVIDYSAGLPAPDALRADLPRAVSAAENAAEVAREHVERVRSEGESGLRALAEEFDGAAPASFRVSQADIAMALQAADPAVVAAFTELVRRLRIASAAQLPSESTSETIDGGSIRQRYVPVRRAGLYVPGGKAVYPSSVAMNVVPAQTAGVESIAIVTPAQREFGGSAHPTILAAAAVLGIDEVWTIGGAGAIGALAYGVPAIGLEPVDMISGPGNRFVAAAKRYVSNHVGIDSEAGTTEILIIADGNANPKFVAADLISQAEHDELAGSILVSDSKQLIDETLTEVERQLAGQLNEKRARESLAGTQSAAVLVAHVNDAITFSNAYAPEHLEIQTAHADAVAELTTQAGAVFVGNYSPVSLGDYLAGSNHILPTGGTAAFSSGLGTLDFLRPQQVVTFSEDALKRSASGIDVLSEAEGLPAHGAAATIRFR